MDPLAIGATDDDVEEAPRHAGARDPGREPRRAICPDEPEPVGDATEAARRALEQPVDGPTLRRAARRQGERAVIIDNQFRPTPSSKLLPAVFDAIEAAGVRRRRHLRANGKVFPMSESDMEQKLGRRQPGPHGANGWPFRQNDPQNADAYTFVGVSSGGTPVWLQNEVAAAT